MYLFFPLPSWKHGDSSSGPYARVKYKVPLQLALIHDAVENWASTCDPYLRHVEVIFLPDLDLDIQP